MLTFLKKSYRNLNVVKISEAALRHNYQTLQSFHPEAKIVPVLKSNAYGHGLEEVAPIFDSLGAPFLVVDSLFEAYELQKLKVKTPILILGYTNPENLILKKLPFHFTIFDLDIARALQQVQRKCKVHIFVDTGMHREGVPLHNLKSFVQQVKSMSNLEIVGLVSHFADADNPKDTSFVQLQIENYKKALHILESEEVVPQFRQISASGGAFKVHDKVFNIMRSGLANYGINPLEKEDSYFNKLKLRPVLTLTSTLAQIKEISKGDKVGYNGLFVAKKKMKVGLLPLGYYEGVDRRLSNKGIVLIQGKECQILGGVSMNMVVVDLEKVEAPKVGDEVVVYSSNSEDKNSLAKAAKTAQTIPYELMVHIAGSVKRKVVE